MPKIRIDYDAGALEAVLSADQPSRYWDVIIRTCREQSDDARLSGGLELRIPWWAFVACRKAIGFQILHSGAEVEFSDAANDRLVRANQRDEELSRARTIPDVTDTRILTALKQNGFTRPLKEFQAKNIRRLCRLPVGASFSVPGAGKTTEALAFFSYYRQSHSRLLVVAPKNAFAAWEEQLSLCIPDSLERFVRLTGGISSIERTLNRVEPALMLVTYEQFPTVATIVARYLGRFDSFLFLDESHRIKGGTARVRATALLRASQVAKYRLILSGTPLPNSDSDLVPQFKFIAPELEVNEEAINKEIEPFFVRTTKKDLQLPPPKTIVVPVRMHEAQRQLYELLRSELARDAQRALARNARRALRQIGRSAVRLLQYVSNPALLAGKVPDFDDLLGAVIEEGDSPKLEWACRRARQLARQKYKVIIWSSFVENVEILAERLEDLGADYIHGGVEASSDADADSREAKIKRFHDDTSAMVLVANPAACGEGISLHTVCHHAIYLDRNYNAAQYLQSVDRIHRIGSDQQKYVEILESPDSVDASVGKRLDDKISRMAAALNDPYLRVAPVSVDPDQIDLDADDILDLLAHLRGTEALAA